MTRHNPSASSIAHPQQGFLGQRLIYASCGLTERSASSMMEAVAERNSLAPQISSEPVARELDTISRSAHEDWMLRCEAPCTPAIDMRLEFPQQRIPMSEGESSSVLQAPEVGIFLILDTTQSGDLAQQEMRLSNTTKSVMTRENHFNVGSELANALIPVGGVVVKLECSANT